MLKTSVYIILLDKLYNVNSKFKVMLKIFIENFQYTVDRALMRWYIYLREVMAMPKGENGHSFEAFYKRATSPLVVLRLLSEKTMYGYELTQEMKKRSGGKYTIAILYPVLYRLIEQGYIAEDRTEVVGGRARTYYAITDEGRAYFKKTLREYYVIADVFDALMGGSPDE